MKAGNTLDTLVTENGRSVVKHYLQDVGSTFGMANDLHDWDVGWEHFYEGGAVAAAPLSFGFALSPWQTRRLRRIPVDRQVRRRSLRSATWRPQTPTTAYMEMRDDDAFWAARRVVAFTDELIRAAVHTGQFSDAAAETLLGDVLIKRRDKIGAPTCRASTPSSSRGSTRRAS